MGLISKFLSKEATSPIQAVGNIFDELFTSKEEKLTLEVAMQRVYASQDKIQAEINKVQAAHRSLFVAGARPASMWICNIALLFGIIAKLIFPAIVAILPLCGEFNIPDINNSLVNLNSIDTGFFTPILLGLLGIGGFRTVEKLNGVAI